MTREGRDVDRAHVCVGTCDNWLGQSNQYNEILNPILIRANLPCHFTPYSTRHTMATLLLRGGVSLKAVSVRLVHESVETTLKHYAHALPDDQEKAVTVLNGI